MEEHKIDRMDEESVDLLRILREFRKAFRRLFWLPLLLAVLCGGLLGFCRWRTYTPVYESTATFTVRTVSTSLTDIASVGGYYDKAAAEQLSKTFPYLLRSELMQTRLKKVLGVSVIPGTISAQTAGSTNLFSLRVTGPDPREVYDLLQAVILVYPEVADYVVGQTELQMLTEPVQPAQPVTAPHTARAAIKGACLGLAAGLALVLLYGSTRKTLRDREDVRRLLNQKCLGVLPRVRFKRRTRRSAPPICLTEKQTPDGFRESVRGLRVKVLRELERTGSRVILVTSTMPGEGKSTVAVNLALSLAQNGAGVILVDLDLRKPSVKKILGISVRSAGVAELLAQNREDAYNALLPVEGTGLRLLAGDKASVNIQRAVHSHRLRRIIHSLREHADYIILDTPPSGLLADSVAISHGADCALYVLGANAVERAGAMDGLQFLSAGGVSVLGCVLNGAESGGSGAYGYGGSYGYSGKYAARRGSRKDEDAG